MRPEEIADLVCDATNANRILDWIPVQSLWSGYGQIWRAHLDGADVPSVIVKQIQPPQRSDQPRGWNTNQAHQRKLRSYEVESRWYQDWGHRLNGLCRVPFCYAVESGVGGNHCFVLEDLDASGFDQRVQDLVGDPTSEDNPRGSNEVGPELRHIKLGLDWLAQFHALFLGSSPQGLWTTGTYWHLETRPDEWAAMSENEPLKSHAAEIDQRLKQCRFPTLVHGDAKIANFCVAEDGLSLAAVDFQYVGGGCGMKDVAYFLGSCLHESALQRDGERWLTYYLEQAKAKIAERHAEVSLDEFETDARSMYPLAWADFQRFLMGWFPDHTKLHGYSQRLTQQALESINRESVDGIHRNRRS